MVAETWQPDRVSILPSALHRLRMSAASRRGSAKPTSPASKTPFLQNELRCQLATWARTMIKEPSAGRPGNPPTKSISKNTFFAKQIQGPALHTARDSWTRAYEATMVMPVIHS